MNVNQDRREEAPVPSGAKMPPPLGEPPDEPESVLDPEGHTHHAVSLKLGHVDDNLIPVGVLTEKKVSVGRYPASPFYCLFGEGDHLDGKFPEHVGIAPVPEDTVQRLISRAVPQTDGAGMVDKEFNEGTKKIGVGGYGPVGGLRGKEVGFDKDAARRNVEVDPAECSFKKAFDLPRVIGVTPPRHHLFQMTSPGRN